MVISKVNLYFIEVVFYSAANNSLNYCFVVVFLRLKTRVIEDFDTLEFLDLDSSLISTMF